MSDDLAELRRLEAAATPAPWGAIPQDGRGGYRVLGPPEPDGRRVQMSDWAGAANAALIVAARNALPALLDRLEHLERAAPELLDKVIAAERERDAARALGKRCAAKLVELREGQSSEGPLTDPLTDYAAQQLWPDLRAAGWRAAGWL